MSYWENVLDAVMQKNAVICYEDEIAHEKEKRDLRTYYLNHPYSDVYLTRREAECLFWLVQEYTINETAFEMNLSPRTVEYYVKNIKIKLCCETKRKLINTILQSDLLLQLEKEGLCIVKH